MRRASGSAIEGGHGFDDRLDRPLTELGIQREREHLGGGALRLREGAAAEPECRERRLQVQRHPVVHLRADARGGEMGLQGVPK